MSEKSALWTAAHNADACHNNVEHTASVEHEHSSGDMFALQGLIGLPVQLIDGVIAAARVLCWTPSKLERDGI